MWYDITCVVGAIKKIKVIQRSMKAPFYILKQSDTYKTLLTSLFIGVIFLFFTY
jgi:hypothetical protein